MPAKQAQLLNELRTHRRGGPVTPAVARHLSAMIRLWRADPTVAGETFNEWCASLGNLHFAEKILVTSVRMAIADPRAVYVPPA